MSELENPVIKTDDVESKLLEAAGLADAGRDIPESLLPEKVETSEEAVETEENEPTEAELADPANKDRARDPVSGKFIKRKPEQTQNATTEAVDASKAAPEPVLSEFEQKKREKAKAEEERKDRSWKAINERKEELERRERALEDQRQQLRQPQQQRRAQEPRQFSSQQLFEASQDFKANAKKALEAGDYDAFNEQQALAEQAQENAVQFYTLEQEENQQAQIQKHQSVWVQNMEKTIKSKPELAKADSPIAQELQSILKSHGQILQMLPDGFDRGVELAQLRLDSKETPTLREENKKLKAEVDRLNGLTAPSPGGVTTAPTSGSKSFDKMSTDEQEQHVLAMAARMDSGQ